MNEFVTVEILSTITGCSTVIALLTQVFKKYLPEEVDTKWLALIFSVIIGTLRVIYIGQLDFSGIVAGVINIFVLLSVAIGLYEIGDSVTNKVITLLNVGGSKNVK